MRRPPSTIERGAGGSPLCRTTPFLLHWKEAKRLFKPVPSGYNNRRLLFGRIHRIMFPGIALQTQGHIGNVRHALSQRVVAGTMYVQAPFEHVDLSRWMPKGVAPQIAQQQAGAPPVDGVVPQTPAQVSAQTPTPSGQKGASMPDLSAVQPLTAGSMFSMDISGAFGLPPLPAPPAQESRVLTDQQEQRLTKDQKANLKPMSELMAQLAAQKKASVQASDQAEEKKRAQAAALQAARQAQVSSRKGLTRTIFLGENSVAGTEAENPVSSVRPVSPMSPYPGTAIKPMPEATPDPATGPGRKQKP
jgi:hypothetical protein